jgi:hypothetical protein
VPFGNTRRPATTHLKSFRRSAACTSRPESHTAAKGAAASRPGCRAAAGKHALCAASAVRHWSHYYAYARARTARPTTSMIKLAGSTRRIYGGAVVGSTAIHLLRWRRAACGTVNSRSGLWASCSYRIQRPCFGCRCTYHRSRAPTTPPAGRSFLEEGPVCSMHVQGPAASLALPTSIVQILQEWRRTLTVVAYADGQMSGPSTYGPARPTSRLTLGVSLPSA